MALWPFKRRKRKDPAPEEPDDDDQNLGISTHITGGSEVDIKQAKKEGRGSTSKSRSRQVSKTRESDVVSPFAAVSPLPAALASVEKIPLSAGKNNIRPPLAEVPNRIEAPPVPTTPKDRIRAAASQTSVRADTANSQTITPTLAQKRSRGYSDMPRQKSTKRRAEEKDRLRELKAMSAPIPVPNRPPSYDQTVASPAIDPKDMRSASTRYLPRPMSEISLGHADSQRSSFSGTRELSSSYRVSPFDALSPRPTIRYAESPRRASESVIPSRTPTQKDKGPAIPEEEEDFSPRARMENLADDLDASALRELMERDRRRRDRKKKSKAEKAANVERRLQAHAAKQRGEAFELEGAPLRPVDATGDVPMHDVDQAGPSTAQHGPNRSSSIYHEDAPSSSKPLDDRPSSKHADRPRTPGPHTEVRRSPVPEPEQSPSSPFRDPSYDASPLERTATEKEDPVVETAQAVQMSPAVVLPPSPLEPRHPRGPSNLSLVTTPTPPPRSKAREYVKEIQPSKPAEKAPEVEKVPGAEPGGAKRWKSIFRRGGTKNRGSSDRSRGSPSEFSNTSRESFARQPPPPVVPRNFKPPATTAASASNIVRRSKTQSKFREDLPEYPVSPQSSRNSRVPPESDSPISPTSPTSPYIDDAAKMDAMNKTDRATTPMGDVHPALRGELSLSRGHSVRSVSPEGPSAALLSQSLASVDSEGSWLSSGRGKRASNPISSLRESGGSVSEHVGPATAEGGAAHPEATYFARRDPAARSVPGPQPSGITAQLARGLASPGLDEGGSAAPSTQQSPTDSELKGGEIAGHRPIFVESAPSHRSRVGLIIDDAGETSPGSQKTATGTEKPSTSSSPERPDSSPEPGPEEVLVQQAIPVDLNKGSLHTRRVSAGSARILDIPARAHSEKRNSALSFGSSKGSPALPPHGFGSSKGSPALPPHGFGSSKDSPAQPQQETHPNGTRARTGPGNGDEAASKRQSTMSVHSSGPQQGLGLGLRLAPQVVSTGSATAESRAQRATEEAGVPRESLDE